MTTEADTGHQLDTLIGASIFELDTPAVLLDLDKFERNADSIQRVLADHGMTWRPHSKAHKSPRLAQLQLAHGAIGVTCAKLAEAEVMVAGGITDVLVANQLGSAAKWQRAATLQRQASVTVCVDDPQHVHWASAAATQAGVTIPLLIEVDVGMHRTGVTSHEAALALAALITVHDGVRLAGLMGYEGHLLRVWPQEEKTRQLTEAMSILTGTAYRLREVGYPVDIVSSGGTGSFETTAGLPGLTESQAGGGCLMDRFYAEDCHVELDHALTVLTTVVSRQAEGRAIVDAGFKALGSLPGFQPPWVIDPKTLHTVGLSAEHGILADDAGTTQVGDRVHFVPAYSDAMLFLHDHVVGHRDGRVTEIVAMPGRGRLV
jgi:D-serine deaminase-like pyridoxal phosphate-dependent protein